MGKAGRAETSTDPAPLSMIETVILLKPRDQWPKVHTFYENWPKWARRICQHIQPDHVSTEDLVNKLDAALRIPGVSNAWTMPIKNRIDMQTTGIRPRWGSRFTDAT